MHSPQERRYRSSKTLRIKYEGLKHSVRKKSASIRAELYITGGGTSTATPLDPVEENIKSMIVLSTDGMESCYDSDVIKPPLYETQESQDGLNNVSMEEFIIIQPVETDTVSDGIQKIFVDSPHEKAETDDEKYVPTPSTSSFMKWDVTSRRFLKSKKYPALAAVNTNKNSFDALAQAKLELVQLQKSLVEAEIKEKQKEWDIVATLYL